jgi:hypothetical protein
VVSVTSPDGRSLCSLDRSRYLSFKYLLSCTHEAEWTPFQTHYFSENLVVWESNTDLWICSQELWPPDHGGDQVFRTAEQLLKFERTSCVSQLVIMLSVQEANEIKTLYASRYWVSVCSPTPVVWILLMGVEYIDYRAGINRPLCEFNSDSYRSDITFNFTWGNFYRFFPQKELMLQKLVEGKHASAYRYDLTR